MKIIFLDIDGVLATNKEFATNRTKFREKYLWAKELRVPYKFNKGYPDIKRKRNLCFTERESSYEEV